MRESFVIHSEYIEDLPEELKLEFLSHSYNYGIKETLPQFPDDMVGTLKQSLWMKIQRRIDADITTYEDQKRKKQEYKKKWESKKHSETFGNILNDSESFGEIPPYTNTNTDTHSVYVPVSVSDNVSDNVSVSVYDTVSASETPSPVAGLLPPEFMTNEDYSKVVYNLWKESGLPCADYFTWLQRDFKRGLETIHKNHYSSSEVIEACKNYIHELNAEDSYVSTKMGFGSFASSKLMYNCLSGSYSHSAFIDYKKKEEPKYTGQML